MSGDLEDFLKRAAERRQAKAVQKNPSSKRVPPQYSNRSSERVPPVNDIVEATIVEEVIAADLVSSRKPVQERSARELQARQQEKPVIVAAAPREPGPYHSHERASYETNLRAAGFSAADLINLLKHPEGVQQAILLREILDRPEHRW